MKKKPVLIIDGSLYLYRSYYAFPNLVNIEGHPYGAIYGTIKTIFNILKQYRESKKIIIIFDSSQKTFRNQLFKEYKKNRLSMPHSLYVQINPLLIELKKIGIKTLQMPGVEADDIIGSLAKKSELQGEYTLIVSYDKDMLQLVTNKINILHTKNRSIITPDAIKNKYGIKPIEFIDFLALMGDTSDNIPGIPGIGKKISLSLLKKFSNIKNIYNNIEKIQHLSLRSAKYISNQLKIYKKNAFLSYKLAKIKLDIATNIRLKEIELNTVCMKKFYSFFKKCNF
ncbi:5'-3' exonuclease [Buchnera aphidicola (Muscaphis stroyani)]|uniref:5'-3' exonuclease n=1 Tax=Buchnera aphidicola (Muscaphis stroyani) TaxID=1241869 RepID=A0A4D6YFC4_9GAMM|nr:5'-3' exonuclease H3TH domain-containing protein [Buchnera aphidicola]QCI24478.1 5'-3' exonuclease [Buchnera aphidicola (Muscaphis stroyani)]